MREISYHEDDYCQIELLPLTNWPFCSEQMKLSDAFANEPHAEVGWADVYVPPEPPYPMVKVGIRWPELAACIQKILPPFDHVVPTDAAAKASTRTAAFGPHEGVVLFVEFNADNLVTAAWLTLDISNQPDIETVLRAFEVLASRWYLILADWGWNTLIHISDTKSLSSYLEQRMHVFASLADQANSDPGA